MVATIAPERQNHATLLRSAHIALDHGLGLAAGVMARVAVESHLKMLCKSHDCEPDKRRATAREYLGKLYNKHHVTKAMQRQVKLILRIGDHCAHNEPVSWVDIQYAVNAVGEFIDCYPMAPWWEEIFPTEDS